MLYNHILTCTQSSLAVIDKAHRHAGLLMTMGDLLYCKDDSEARAVPPWFAIVQMAKFAGIDTLQYTPPPTHVNIGTARFIPCASETLLSDFGRDQNMLDIGHVGYCKMAKLIGVFADILLGVFAVLGGCPIFRLAWAR